MDCTETDRCPYFMKRKPKSDGSVVNHPVHYQGEYECIDLMREIYGDEAVRWFCICNAYKYRFRAGKKQNETAQDDISKAEWYERYVMEHIAQNTKLELDRMAKRIREMNEKPLCHDDELGCPSIYFNATTGEVIQR